MNITNYQTGETIGISTSIDETEYREFLENDGTGTGAVRAGDWISADEIAAFGISADLTIYAE